MRKRRPNHRRAKIHLNYTLEEAAKTSGVHKNTVRTWIKNGLSCVSDKKPILILGHDLKDFLHNKRRNRKRPCKPGQLYCLRCRAPKFPAGNFASYRPVTDKIGNLEAICPDCDAVMNQAASLAKIGRISEKIEILLPEALRRLKEIY